MEEVVLVDEQDREVGSMEKMEAHRRGVLHRAFSVLLFNSKGEMLLQKRAHQKYHSAGLWSNACCSHPLPGEGMEAATRRKLKQEMGLDVPCEFAYKFIYEVPLENGLTEHELDHVYIGRFDGQPSINKSEVEDWRVISPAELRMEIQTAPEQFSYWFKLIMNHRELQELTAS
jgi:isopentenyl-diphosphate delta-isomerase